MAPEIHAASLNTTNSKPSLDTSVTYLLKALVSPEVSMTVVELLASWEREAPGSREAWVCGKGRQAFTEFVVKVTCNRLVANVGKKPWLQTKRHSFEPPTFNDISSH